MVPFDLVQHHVWLLKRVLLQLMMPSDTAHDTVLALGHVGLLQFKDLNPDKGPMQRTFASQVLLLVLGKNVCCMLCQ